MDWSWENSSFIIQPFDSEISVEGYLAQMGLTGSLPSSHDYKASLPALGKCHRVKQGLADQFEPLIISRAGNQFGWFGCRTISFTTVRSQPPALSVPIRPWRHTTATTKGNLLSFDGTKTFRTFIMEPQMVMKRLERTSNVDLSTKPMVLITTLLLAQGQPTTTATVTNQSANRLLILLGLRHIYHQHHLRCKLCFSDLQTVLH